MLRPAAKPKARSRSATSVASTVLYPEDMAGPLPVVPEDAPAPPPPPPPERPVKPVKKTTLKVKKLADDSSVARPQEKKMPRKPREKKMPKPPEAPSQAGRKPRIKKVQITEEPPAAGELPVKRGRGRPKGSLGKKKRDLLRQELEAALLVGAAG